MPVMSSRPWCASPVATLALVVALTASVGPASAASTVPTRTIGHTTMAAAQADPITDLASQLDFDVDRIFRFVSDEIRYEPYVGILRGAAGTLETRAGNSVDKALLLGALLDASLVPYRFARGPLGATTVAGIMTSTSIDAAGARSIGRDAAARDLDELARVNPPAPAASDVPADQEPRLGEIEAAAKEGLAIAQTRLEETASTIESALRGAGISLPTDGVSMPPAEVEAHTWVQARSGSAWRDLDPTMTGAVIDTALATASETLDRLPDELRYLVDFKVDVEHVAGGQLVTDEVLAHSVFADEVAGTPITFGHMTPSALKQLGVTIGGLFGDGWLDYRPTLDLGATAAVADTAVAIPLGTGGGDILSAGGPPSPGAGPVDGEATAEWLEVRVTAPGAEPEIARRTVFDRLPADLRSAGRLDPGAIEPIELVDAEGDGQPAYLPMLGGRTFVITTGATSTSDIVANADDSDVMLALAFGGLRGPLVESLALDAGARTFVDGPNIVSVTLEVLDVGQVPTVGIGLDIWHRDHGVLPLMASSTTAAEARLRKGVADHITERYVVDSLAREAGSDVQPSGVGAVFEAAAAQGIPISVLRDTIPDALPIGPRATALIAGALDDGDVVIVPAEPVTIDGTEHIGWWRVDPATGAATDVMDGGAGTSMVEQAKIYDEQNRWRWALCKGLAAAVTASAIATAISLNGGPTPDLARYLRPGGYGGTTCRVI
jgi:hypothetical protein